MFFKSIMVSVNSMIKVFIRRYETKISFSANFQTNEPTNFEVIRTYRFAKIWKVLIKETK